ncbi:hypothetical protein [Streptomyces sp. DSM 40750]|uniref:hypothetical protein n=1 Tax=Streptomyces sp. DSM 40750 TaxID=2801030 RepID=UPI00214C31D1|nr:hypothetical protein [Streptomyces sp. DSM 40750]UUU19324.1 hypothetical protein JIX55_02815 [Streptomyces sp. DSM 40750]UUU27333.1 hypothetical protein JIX55_47935 [Streptomyces sp. DSM 40750]
MTTTVLRSAKAAGHYALLVTTFGFGSVTRYHPFPNPKNNAEREVNREASDEYQRQE